MAVTDRDVMLALLSLDAYNRHESGINRKFGDAAGNQLSDQIGDVTFITSSDVEEKTKPTLSGSKLSGFSGLR
jgi:hypothetical protein